MQKHSTVQFVKRNSLWATLTNPGFFQIGMKPVPEVTTRPRSPEFGLRILKDEEETSDGGETQER
jgi:hypothetical protein